MDKQLLRELRIAVKAAIDRADGMLKHYDDAELRSIREALQAQHRRVGKLIAPEEA